MVGVRPRRGVENFQITHLLTHLAGPEGLTEKDSTFDRRHALQAVAAGLPAGAPVELIEQIVDVFLDRPDIVALGDSRTFMHLTRYSTTELLRLEQRLIDSAVGPPRRPHRHRHDTTRRRRRSPIGPRLADEQIDMVDQLCRGGSGVVVVAAAAGTGKTYALDAARDAWEPTGYRVLGAALAAKAARELESAAGIPSCTLASSPATSNTTGSGSTAHRDRDRRGRHGRHPTTRPDPRRRQTAGAKVVLVGDPHQLPEIDAGGMLDALTRILDPITLAENRRQRDHWERDALAELRTGDVDAALDAYQPTADSSPDPTPSSVRQAMVDDWWAARPAGEQVVMMAVRRTDVDDLNGRARRHLEAAGAVHGPSLEVNQRRYQAGDEIICLRNDYRLGVRNGDRATIEPVDPDQRTMRIRTDQRDPNPARRVPRRRPHRPRLRHHHPQSPRRHRRPRPRPRHRRPLPTSRLRRPQPRPHHQHPLRRRRQRTRPRPHPRTPTQTDNRRPADLVRDALHRDASKELAIESADPMSTSGASAEPNDDDSSPNSKLSRNTPPPAVDDDFGLGL